MWKLPIYVLSCALDGLSLAGAAVLLAGAAVLLAAALVRGNFRTRAVSLARSLDRMEEYRERKRALDRETPFRYVPWIFWFVCGTLAVSIAMGLALYLLYLAVGVVNVVLFFGMGWMGDSDSFFFRVSSLIDRWPGALRVLIYVLYATGTLTLVRDSYLQWAVRKALEAAAPEEEP